MSILIETPYGKKHPDFLCRAMDAYELQPELLAALKLAAHVLQANEADKGMAGEFEIITDAIAKATGEA